ncbi:hypothetical protein [Aurantiacibacter rhizosphaerae]|uniref:Uncharacterized protein n=1 Tax=Aurantiacibacter rhizosphaerae TaxID=2691582 RepID=A0A844XG64_9SPHN|nr:hypothetical protein [Aurantiacibacter rhizosphaerae]MWV28729.1 hypothetical protein [Aurantiacibacter rhizosphaerae]
MSTRSFSRKASRITRAALGATLAFTVTACVSSGTAMSQNVPMTELPDAQAPTYADLVTMAMEADTVAIVAVEEQIAFPQERAPDVPPSEIRLYIESLTQSLLAGPQAVGAQLAYVVDQRRDADGKAPDLEGRQFLVFGDLSQTQPGALQLLSSDSMLPAGPQIEARVRRVLTQLAAADAPPMITGLRDVISVPGNLVGESETQMFVETSTGQPVSLTVIRRPGMAPQWGVSLGELVDAAAEAPERDTLVWYRLACSLPRELPADAFLQSDRTSQDQARADYAYILSELGNCERRFT